MLSGVGISFVAVVAAQEQCATCTGSVTPVIAQTPGFMGCQPSVVQVLGQTLSPGTCDLTAGDCTFADPCSFSFTATLNATNCAEPVAFGWAAGTETGSGFASEFQELRQKSAHCGRSVVAWLRAGGVTSTSTGACSDCP